VRELRLQLSDIDDITTLDSDSSSVDRSTLKLLLTGVEHMIMIMTGSTRPWGARISKHFATV
jgi:hypothetical protein